MLLSTDKSLMYYVNVSSQLLTNTPSKISIGFRKVQHYVANNFMMFYGEYGRVYSIPKSEQFCKSYFCETVTKYQIQDNLILTVLHTSAENLSGKIMCPLGHFVHRFLACDVKSLCLANTHKSQCSLGAQDTETQIKVRQSMVLQSFVSI